MAPHGVRGDTTCHFRLRSPSLSLGYLAGVAMSRLRWVMGNVTPGLVHGMKHVKPSNFFSTTTLFHQGRSLFPNRRPSVFAIALRRPFLQLARSSFSHSFIHSFIQSLIPSAIVPNNTSRRTLSLLYYIGCAVHAKNPNNFCHLLPQ
jgi:hypothetical protein